MKGNTERQAVGLLKDHYLKNLKENPQLLIGVELEFPIVEKSGQPTDIAVTKNLLKELSKTYEVEIGRASCRERV